MNEITFHCIGKLSLQVGERVVSITSRNGECYAVTDFGTVYLISFC